jgi:uncharacterized protein (DUF302 family)
MKTTLGQVKTLDIGFDDALARVPEALQREGFGVLTEIDVTETLKHKLGVEFRRYRILGACNPPIAYQALQANLGAGVLMPCNVVIYEDDRGRAVVQAVDPMETAAAQAPELAPIAQTVREKLGRVLASLA